MSSHEGDNLPERTHAEADPYADPGLPDHVWRPTDVDPASEKRAERQIATLFGLSAVCAVLFVVAYFTLEIGEVTTTFAGLGASTVALGLTLSGALLFIGIGVIQWARKLMSDHEIVEMRHPIASSDATARRPWRWSPRASRSPASVDVPLVRNSPARRSRPAGPPGAVVLLRDLGPAARQRPLHDRLDRGDARGPRRGGHPHQGRRAPDRRPRQRRAGRDVRDRRRGRAAGRGRRRSRS